jgi:hypothetical protein
LERALAELKQSQVPKSVAAGSSAKSGTGAALVVAPEPAKPREATPRPVTTTKPKAPLKSFGSLDALFRK